MAAESLIQPNVGDGLQLYTRVLDQFEAQAIPGTEGARNPIFSPDGEWIVFNAALGAELKKVSTRGGPPQMLNEELFRIYGGDWAPDDTVIISTTDGENVLQGFLSRVPANGGKLEVLTSPGDGVSHVFPSVLPGGTHVLYTNRLLEGPASEANISLLSLDGGESLPLIAGAFNAKYVDTGHIIFARGDALWGVPFDLGKMEISGVETPLVEGVQMNSLLGFAPYGFSDAGLLVYVRIDYTIEGRDYVGALRNLLWEDQASANSNLRQCRAPMSSLVATVTATNRQRFSECGSPALIISLATSGSLPPSASGFRLPASRCCTAVDYEARCGHAG